MISGPSPVLARSHASFWTALPDRLLGQDGAGAGAGGGLVGTDRTPGAELREVPLRSDSPTSLPEGAFPPTTSRPAGRRPLDPDGRPAAGKPRDIDRATLFP